MSVGEFLIQNRHFISDLNDFREIIEKHIEELKTNGFDNFFIEYSNKWHCYTYNAEENTCKWISSYLPSIDIHAIFMDVTLEYFRGECVKMYFSTEEDVSDVADINDNKVQIYSITQSTMIQYYIERQNELKPLASKDPSEYVEKLQELIAEFKAEIQELDKHVEFTLGFWDVFETMVVSMQNVVEIIIETFKNETYYRERVIPIETKRLEDMYNNNPLINYSETNKN